MAKLAQNASTSITLPAGAILRVSGVGVATLGPGRQVGMQIGIGGFSTIGPFNDRDQVVYLTATGTSLNYTAYNQDQPYTDNVYPVKSLTYGGVMDAYNKGVASGRPFIVTATDAIDISSAGQGLPVAAGVGYAGPNLDIDTSAATIPDASAVRNGTGFVLIGDGTFPAFKYNNAALGAPASAAAFTAQGITNFSLRNMGFNNFSSAISAGNTNAASFWYSEFENLFADNCTGINFEINNMSHCKMRRIFSFGGPGGQRYGVSVANTVFIPSNTVMEDIYHVIPNSSSIWTNKGIIFDVTNNGINNQLYIYRLQSNRFNQASNTFTCATNTTTTITSSSSALMAEGLPVSPVSTAQGFTQNLTYYVTNLTGSAGAWSFNLARSKGGTPIAASGTGALSLITWGFPCLEFTGDSTATHLNHKIYGVDIEAGGTVGALLQKFQASKIEFSEFPQSSVSISSFQLVNSPYSTIQTNDTSTTWDADGLSASAFIDTPAPITNARATPCNGNFGGSLNKYGSAGVGVANNYQPTLTNVNNGTLNWTYPGIAMGQRVSTKSAGFTLTTWEFGSTDVVSLAANATVTLPSFKDTSATDTHVGGGGELTNASDYYLTVNTDGTQLFNNKASLTSLVLAPGETLHWRVNRVSQSAYAGATPGTAVFIKASVMPAPNWHTWTAYASDAAAAAGTPSVPVGGSYRTTVGSVNYLVKRVV